MNLFFVLIQVVCDCLRLGVGLLAQGFFVALLYPALLGGKKLSRLNVCLLEKRLGSFCRVDLTEVVLETKEKVDDFLRLSQTDNLQAQSRPFFGIVTLLGVLHVDHQPQRPQIVEAFAVLAFPGSWGVKRKAD